ncbi:MAG: hypothetical protein JSW17_06945 [Candidatus Omnitrophota bacterium]|nr:MAG: hypothetical protein JSW17_06945 [Candidatus Omnitrophota bacterium]
MKLDLPFLKNLENIPYAEDIVLILAVLFVIFGILLFVRLFFHISIGGLLVLVVGGTLVFASWNFFSDYEFGIVVPFIIGVLTFYLFLHTTQV